MQPEEIIQQKEWLQLTDAEKKILEPLAADEQEFNLLKKMLLVADEVSADVPTVAPAVQEQLSRSVKRGNYQRSDRKIWYYAAATVVLVAIAAWFYLRTRADDNNELVKAPPATNNESPIVVNPPAAKETIKDSSQPVDQIASKKDIHLPDIVKTTIPDSALPKDPSPLPNNTNMNQSVAFVNISTLIKDDTELMSLITEVY